MARVVQVIQTEITRGTGKDESSAKRFVTQYWSLDGVLLAEVDPCQTKQTKRVVRPDGTGPLYKDYPSGPIRWRSGNGSIIHLEEGVRPSGDWTLLE